MTIEQVISNLKRAKCVPYKKETLEMAIKALKQEPCEDAISRQAVFEPYQTLKDSDTICIWLLRKNIEQQPPVTPPQRWIPVSERLPEDGQNVLFCDIDDVMLGYHVKGRPNTHFTQDMTFEDMKNVKAWMPLPEPYKAESEET